MDYIKSGKEYVEHIFGIQKIVEDILVYAGFSVSHDARKQYRICDLSATKDGVNYLIEVRSAKYREASERNILESASYISNEAQPSLFNHTTPVVPMLIVVATVSEKLKELLKKDYPEMVLWDISNLLYIVHGNVELYNRLISMLNFSVNTVNIKSPKVDMPVRDLDKQAEYWDALIQRVRDWQPHGVRNFSEYEKLCYDVLKALFMSDLTGWEMQGPSNAGLFRFDLICKIKQGHGKEFWEMVERYFNTKYIVFEFKNYKERVKQSAIFTTVKYLYAKALRSVAILISINGTASNADKAIRGILREEGKLILSLSHEDLIAMLDGCKRGKDPAEYLSAKLDRLLIDLEK